MSKDALTLGKDATTMSKVVLTLSKDATTYD